MKKNLSTTMDEPLLKELKVYCAENDWAINDVLESAVYLFLAIGKNKSWYEIADGMPTGSFHGSALQAFAYEQDSAEKFARAPKPEPKEGRK